MREHTDDYLLGLAKRGDEHAFLGIVRRYEFPVAQLISYTIGNADDAEDVLQETLLDAWMGLRLLRGSGSVRAWLMQVARNRCSDYFRSKGRREIPIESAELEERMNLLNAASGRHRAVTADIVGALEDVPDAERDIAELFYLQGLTIAEIAERHKCPRGTVKRRLFTARHLMRQALGVTTPERTNGAMDKHRAGSKTQPFPKMLPNVEITVSDAEPFIIDCREMRYWGIIPEFGQRAWKADYDSRGCLRRVGNTRVIGSASVHGLLGVEIESAEWWYEEGWRPVTVHYYGRVLEDKVQWLGMLERTNHETCLRTFLDEGFVWAYPDDQRLVSDGDLFAIEPDGSLRTIRPRQDFTEAGAGYFTVKIGGQSFACLRIVGVEGAIDDEATCVTEAFIANNGRMVLQRHYCRQGAALPLDETTNDDVTMTVDGHRFVFFRTTLTDTSCGIPAN